jgi:hypothetical protein
MLYEYVTYKIIKKVFQFYKIPGPRIQDQGPRTQGHRFKDTGSRTQVQGHRFKDTGSRTQVQGHRFKDTGSRKWKNNEDSSHILIRNDDELRSTNVSQEFHRIPSATRPEYFTVTKDE